MPEDPKPKPLIFTKENSKPYDREYGTRTGIIYGGQSQSKYDAGSLLSERGDLNAVRARNQGFWDAAGNTVVNMFTTLAGQTLESVGAFSDVVHNWMAEDDYKLNEGLSGIGQSIQQYGQEHNPIYYDPKQGFNIDYFLSHMPSLVSTAAMLLPGWGLGKGAGLLARAARLGKFGEELLAIGVGSTGMRHAEAKMESAQLYNQIMQEGSQNLDPKYAGLSYEQIQEAAKIGAATTYTDNWMNIAFDVLQMGMLFKPIKGLSGWFKDAAKETKFGQVMDYGYKLAKQKGLLSEASSLNKAGLWFAGGARPFIQQTTEGFEEAWNDVAQKEGYRDAMLKAGAIKDDGSTIFDRIGGYTKDFSMRDSFAWGVLGGVVFQAGGEKLNSLGAKAGWWNDSTTRGQMLADDKMASDVITKGYKQLSDPTFDEYDKAKAKSAILFDLVQRNKRRESLDMLEEDLDNPMMVKEYAKRFGFNEEDTKKEMAVWRNDVKYINEQIDYYTGESMKGWFGQPTTHTGLGIEGDQEVTVPGVQPFAKLNPLKKDKGNVRPFVYDPRIAQILAHNDYGVLVNTRLNKQATGDMLALQTRAFEGTDFDANSRSVFNLKSDITALTVLNMRESEELANKKERGLSDVFVKAAEHRVNTSAALLKTREKQLKELQSVMNSNVESKISENTFEKAEKHAEDILGSGSDVGKHAGLKSLFYVHLLDNEEYMMSNKRILDDPKKYIEDYITSDISNQLFEHRKNAEAVRIEAEQATINKALEELTSENNEAYTTEVKRQNEAITDTLTKYPTAQAKIDYLIKESTALVQSTTEHATAGKFSRKNMKDFADNYDKELYVKTKARQAALATALAPYKEEFNRQEAAKAAAESAVSAGKTSNDISILSKQFDKNTPGNYYKGMVYTFGADGKGGKWNTLFMESPDSGIKAAALNYNNYLDSTTQIKKVLDNYARLKGAADPNARATLKDASGFIRRGEWRYDDRTPEGDLFAGLQEELEDQEKALARYHKGLFSPVTESWLWQSLEPEIKSSDFSGMGVSITSMYPETMAFLKGLVKPYTNIADLLQNMATVNADIQKGLEDAKAAYEITEAAAYVAPVTDKVFTEEDIHNIVDLTNKDLALQLKEPTSKHFSNSDNLFPGTHSKKVTAYDVVNGKWVTRYTEGKQTANPAFNIGYTIFVDKDNTTMNGFVQQGMPVDFIYSGDYYGNDENSEKKIYIKTKDGHYIGELDTTYRIKTSIATLEEDLKKPDITEKEKTRLEGTIKKYNDLIPYYNEIRKRFTNKDDKFSGTVAVNISNGDNTLNSGGVRFGNVIRTQNSVPVDINTAFNIADVNRKGGVKIAIYSEKKYLVKDPTSDNYVDVEALYGDEMSLPPFARQPETRYGQGTYNGAVFALIPTNTFDQRGKRIYMHMKLYNRPVTNVKLTSDGNAKDKTVPEQILDVITDPDAHSEEFRMLATSVNVNFKKEYDISHPENRKNVLAFYTTANILKIFNRVIYAYDSTIGAKRFEGRDYSHHIGMNVFDAKVKKDSTEVMPVLKFDLSNDTSVSNTYVIRLFTEDGNFKPYFGFTSKTDAQLATKDVRDTLEFKGEGRTDVDVKAEIVKRLRQKLSSVDLKLLTRNSDKNEYKALVFENNRLVEQPYESYLHYLANRQIIESTVTGVDFVAKDPKTGVEKTGRTYFDNQSFWFELDPVKSNVVPESPVASSNNNNSTGQPINIGPIQPEPQPGGKPVIHQAILNSQELSDSGALKRPGAKGGLPDKYLINGMPYDRVSSILNPGSTGGESDATKAGTLIDRTIKDILNGKAVDLKAFSKAAAEQITKAAADFKTYLASKGQTIVGTDIVLYATIRGADGVNRNIAGETDIMTVDQNGKFFIYDFKTSTDGFSLETYQRQKGERSSSYTANHNQLSAYSALLSHMTNTNGAEGIGIVPITLTYNSTKGDIFIDVVMPYDFIMFPDKADNFNIPAAKQPTDSTTKATGTSRTFTEDETDGMVFNNTELNPDPTNLWMSDLDTDPSVPEVNDIAQFRDKNKSYPQQKVYEDFMAQTMMDALYEHQITLQNEESPTYKEIRDMAVAIIERRIAIVEDMIASIKDIGGITIGNDFRPMTEAQLMDKERQLTYLKDILKNVDSTTDYIGYGKAGFMILSANKIIDVNVEMEELTLKGAKDQAYTVRYSENYSVKINPKLTLGNKTRIFLSRIPELQRTLYNDQIQFKQTANMFGLSQYIPLNTIVDALLLDLEMVAPERFMDKLEEMNNNNPIIRSIMATLKTMERRSKNQAMQTKQQLSTLLKQRRDQRFLKVETDEAGLVESAQVIEAARLGIKNNIIKVWENLFRISFKKFFTVDELNTDLRSNAHTIAINRVEHTFTEKGVNYDTAEFKLPADFTPSTHTTTWQIEWLYDQLKSIANGNTKKRIHFTFESGLVSINGKKLGMGETDIAQMLLLFDTKNFIIDSSLAPLLERKANDKYKKITKLEQLVASIDYFSRVSITGATTGDPTAPKDRDGYAPIYYKIMADQMNRFGIQLSEDPIHSWTVLQDMNSTTLSGKKRRYQYYDSQAESFNYFIVDKMKRSLLPLLNDNALKVGQQEYIDQDGGELMGTQKTINIENPFNLSLSGLDPFAKHSRSEWLSYANSTIRNTSGDLEFTNTDPNGLSTMITKLRDEKNGYLQAVASTPIGRYNLFVQNLQNSIDALTGFSLHYVDAGKIDNSSIVEPDDLNLAKSHLLIWNNYYNNETKTTKRNKGGYITTHSDSSIMPIFSFDKLTIPLDFVESIGPDGVRSYRVKLNEVKDGNPNPAYAHLYGMFRGELQRIQETYEKWADINRKEWSEEQRISYAFKNYTMGIDFNFEEGKLSKGNGIHLYQFGSTMFDGNKSLIYADKSKSALDTTLFDNHGNPNEANIKSRFDVFANEYLNEMIDDAYKDLLKMGSGFFTKHYVDAPIDPKNPTKTIREAIRPSLMDQTAVAAMESIFQANALVVTPGQLPENVSTRKVAIEKEYSEGMLRVEGLKEAEAKAFVAEKNAIREEDKKASTYSELFMKYLVSEMAINYSIFYGSLFSIMADPAVFEHNGTYKKFKDQFEKRMKGPVSPGHVAAFDEKATVKIVAYEDILEGDIKISLDGVKLSDYEQEFIDEFSKHIPPVNGKYPSRIFEYQAFYYGMPKEERHTAWKLIKDMMKTKITDGGSNMTMREYLYRLLDKGQINKKQYFDTLDFYYKKDESKRAVASKILKDVYAGNNVTNNGNFKSNVFSYLKHSTMPMVPGSFEGTVFDDIRKQLEEIEAREYAGYAEGEPRGGILMVPHSSFKTAFSSAAKLIDEDGQPTRDLISTRIIDVNRGWLRDQIQAPDEKDRRATITTQGNILTDLNALGYYKYGQRGEITFSRLQGSEPVVEYDENLDEVATEDSGTGISSNVIQNSNVNTITEIAKRRLTDKIYELGLGKKDNELVIESVTRFLAQLKRQSVTQFGIGSIAAAYLDTIKEGNDDVLPIPITFTAGGKRIQSVLLSELKEIFYKLTLPGGAFTQYSAAGIYPKGKINADSQLKGYRVHVHKSKKYNTAEEANKDFAPEEIHKEWNPSTGIVEYYTFDPAEAIIPWGFKDADGKLLDYDTYIDENGRPREGMFDPRLFLMPAFRIPNTGPNASATLKAVKFTRPGHGDGIATAPEVVYILGADFDYDKLYTYMYNYKIGENGKLEKVESVLHHSQDKQDFQSAEARRQYASNELMQTAEYRELQYRLKSLKAEDADVLEDLNVFLQASSKSGKKVGLDSLAGVVSNAKPEGVAEQIRLMEDEFMMGEHFDKNYAKASIYEKQSIPALENALIDRFNIILGDFKTFRQMTKPTSSAWLEKQVEAKIIPVVAEDGSMHHLSVNEALNDNQFHSITSFNSFNRSRLANSAAAVVIPMSANAQLSQQQGQRWNLSVSHASIEPKFRKAHEVRFKDSNGKLKQEDQVDRNNSSHNGKRDPYTVKSKAGKVIYEPPSSGRFRLDRVWVIDDKGNKVYISTVIQSIIQAALDHQKNPLIDKASITPTSLNAAIGLARLGYVDEIVPLLKQESVMNYITRTSNYYNIDYKDKRIRSLMAVMEQYTLGYGMTIDHLQNIFNALPEKNRTSVIFIQAVMDRLSKGSDTNLSTADLLVGISQAEGLMQKDEYFNLRQLEALRNYIVADSLGKQLFAIQNATAAYSQGLKTSFAAMDAQQQMFYSLFQYDETSGNVTSSAPLIGGLHRISNVWAWKLGRSKDFRKSLMSFGQLEGLNPSMELLQSVQGNIFNEFSFLFREARRQAFLTSRGIEPNASTIGTIGSAEYERVFNKINTNLVSFMFSNKDLFHKLIPNADEFALFNKYGIELITRPHKGIPYDESFSLFNSATSLARDLQEIAEETNPTTGNKYIVDYDVLNALKAILNISYKTPSSVVYNNTFSYQENVSHRIAMSIAEMINSPSDKVNAIGKKLILYAYMTGGITSPNSFVQFIHPSILIKAGFDAVLRSAVQELNSPIYARDLVKSFIIQYYQHHPFELRAEVNLSTIKSYGKGYERIDPETNVPYMEIQEASRAKYEGIYVLRLDNHIYVNEGNQFLVRVDNLGMTKNHRNEFDFNNTMKAGKSLYAHNISNESRVITTELEVRGEMTEPEYVPKDVQDLEDKKKRSVFERIMDKSSDIVSLITDMELDNTNPAAVAVLSYYKNLLGLNNVKVVYDSFDPLKPGQFRSGNPEKDVYPVIAINLAYPGFKGLTTGDPTDLLLPKFQETLAHEVIHAVLYVTTRDVIAGIDTDSVKVKALETLELLVEKAIDVIEKDDDLSTEHNALMRMIATVEADSLAFNDTPVQARIRKISEFMAYVGSNEKFQFDMNNVNFRKQSWWAQFWESILRLLGLDVNDEAKALREVATIQRQFRPTQSYVTDYGEVDRRPIQGSKTLEKLAPYTALHVALREIMVLSKRVKEDLFATQGLNKVMASAEKKIASRTPGADTNNAPTLNMTDLYKDISNFNPTWSDTLKNAYHEAALNKKIIC